MSGLRSFLSDLSPAQAVFLSCWALGLVTAFSGLVGASSRPNLDFALLAFGGWMILGLVLGGIAWVVDSLSSWRSSLTRPTAGRDPALQALRERYACGEIDENQFEAMLSRLKEV